MLNDEKSQQRETENHLPRKEIKSILDKTYFVYLRNYVAKKSNYNSHTKLTTSETYLLFRQAGSGLNKSLLS